MAEVVIERLNESHERAGFHCGKPPLDQFLATLVGQYERRRLGATYVAVEEGSRKVLGYYTCSTGSIDVSAVPESKKLPKHPIPTIHLGRLAVDTSAQGRRLGEKLLFHFLKTALDVSSRIAVFAVDVWSIDETAKAFYLKYGFLELKGAPLHLFLPIPTVADMLGGESAAAERQ